MSIMRCEKHDEEYDSDFVEDCPKCTEEHVRINFPERLTNKQEDLILARKNE